MSNIRKGTYSIPIPDGAKIVTKRAGKFARFKHKGKAIDAPLTKDGAKCRVETDHYYIRYKDRDGKWKRTKGYTDKRATETLALKIQTRVDQKQEAVNPFKEHYERPLSEHVDDWKTSLGNSGVSAGDVRTLMSRVRLVVDACGFESITALRSIDVEECLAGRRNDTRKPMSARTYNRNVQALHRFCVWLVQKGRTDRNHLDDVAALKVTDAEKMHSRRALTADEFTALVNAAERGPALQRVSGPDRAMLYVLVAWTGYRRGELASLTLRSFDLEDDTPTVSVQASYTKNTSFRCIRPLWSDSERGWRPRVIWSRMRSCSASRRRGATGDERATG